MSILSAILFYYAQSEITSLVNSNWLINSFTNDEDITNVSLDKIEEYVISQCFSEEPDSLFKMAPGDYKLTQCGEGSADEQVR